MIRIQKGPEPRVLRTIRETPGANWDKSVHGDDKSDIRHALCAEQGCLCAYCMTRIHPAQGSSRVEHWRPRNTAMTEEERRQVDFTWENLLAVCCGDTGLQGPRLERFHCDNHRDQLVPADQTLYTHPARDNPKFRYLGTGEVKSNDCQSEHDIVTLNLNTRRLRENRKAVLDNLLAEMRSHWDSTHLRALFARATGRNSSGERREYAGVEVYHLERWIRKRG